MFTVHNSSKCPTCAQEGEPYYYGELLAYAESTYYQCPFCHIIYGEESSDRFYSAESETGQKSIWSHLNWFVCQDDIQALREAEAEIPGFKKLHRITGPEETQVIYTLDLRDINRNEELEVEDYYLERFDESEIRSA